MSMVSDAAVNAPVRIKRSSRVNSASSNEWVRVHARRPFDDDGVRNIRAPPVFWQHPVTLRLYAQACVATVIFNVPRNNALDAADPAAASALFVAALVMK
jgi:hypothetical protein